MSIFRPASKFSLDCEYSCIIATFRGLQYYVFVILSLCGPYSPVEANQRSGIMTMIIPYPRSGRGLLSPSSLAV
jgi:hypothetical protein